MATGKSIFSWLTVLPSRVGRRLLFPSAHTYDPYISAYSPNSVASHEQSRMEALLGVMQVPKLLVELSSTVTGSKSEAQSIASFPLAKSEKLKSDEIALGELFREFQSDKSTVHNYQAVYAYLLDQRGFGEVLVEIGIGSRNESTISNMGADGVPGASLRAFSKFAADLHIIGADVDLGAISDAREIDGDAWPRITHEFVDQLEIRSIERLLERIPQDKLFLLIDDGLHSPRANLNVLLAFCGQLNGRWLLIEDIPEESIDIWKVVEVLIRPHFILNLISAKNGYLALIQRIRQGETLKVSHSGEFRSTKG